MHKVFKALLFVCVAVSFSYAAKSGLGAYKIPKDVDKKNGQKIYEEKCASCHGVKGMAPQDSIFPPLNGQYAVYMVTQLEAFADDRPKYKRDSVNSAQMIPFAKMLSKKEMWDVSVYLEDVKERRVFPKEWWAKNKADIDWANKFRKPMCVSCHGRNRAGSYPSAPKLAGLPADYTMAQVKAYSHAKRRGGQSLQMKLIVDFYTDEELRKIALAIESAERFK